MILRILWMLIGFTAWGIENIEYIYDLYMLDVQCYWRVDSFELVLHINFYMLEAIGAIFTVLTLLVIPIALVKLYYEEQDNQENIALDVSNRANKGANPNE